MRRIRNFFEWYWMEIKKNITFAKIFVNKTIIIMKAYSFENLEVWKESRQLVAMVYDVQKLFPDTEKFGLGSQLRRAVISVPSNLVEGNYRTSTKEQLHFIEMAFSSLMEVYCQLILAYDLKFISLERLKECKTKIDSVRKLLNGLRFKKLSLLPKTS